MQGFLYKHRKFIAIIGVLALVVIVGISVFFIVQDRINSATVRITVSPLDAKVKIGEREYDSLDVCKIAPGEYEVLIYAEGFISKTGKLTAVADEEVALATYLDPTAENSDWYETHPWDATARGDIINNAEIQRYYDLMEVEPILNYVPYNTYTYSINYEENCAENADEMCLIVKGNFGMADVAMRYLQNTGQDLSRYFLKYDEGKVFESLPLDVPEVLEFNENTGAGSLASEIGKVKSAAEDFANRSLSDARYSAEVLQVKSYGDYCGVKIKVYMKNGDEDVYDTYRMVLYMDNGEWRAITNLGMILSKYVNEGVPVDLLRQVDAW